MTAKVNDRTVVHRGKAFSLIKENVVLENGTATDVEFIEHPGAAAIVPMLSDTRVILLKQYRHALKNHIWEIPAGTLDPREEIISCARRELAEETGYSAGQWHRLGEITPVPGYSDERIHVFLASDLRAGGRHLDADEIIQVHPLDFAKALAMVADGAIQDAKSIAGLYLASAWLKGKQ